jgi:hypothetical protein
MSTAEIIAMLDTATLREIAKEVEDPQQPFTQNVIALMYAISHRPQGGAVVDWLIAERARVNETRSGKAAAREAAIAFARAQKAAAGR